MKDELRSDDTKDDIFIVDDALPNLRLLSDMLKKEAYSVRGSPNGHTALIMINAQLPDLILLDIRMPEMDGYEVCRQLKANEKTSDIPVIFISALDHAAQKVEGFRAGCVDYISKPFKTEEVLARVKNHLSIRKFQKQIEMQNIQLQQEIAERKRAEKESECSREAAEKANKIKSDFLANMFHEIRTPMNAIMGFTILTLKTDISREQRNYLRKIKKASDALLDIINDTLDFSKIEAGKLKIGEMPFRMKELLEDISDMFSSQAVQKGIRLSISLSPKVPEGLIGDPGRIRQVLVNLTSNAVKFTLTGEIAINITCAKETADDAMLSFKIRDTGIGISEADIHKIFSPFSQADASSTRKYGGTGLGLAICREIAALMGGSIQAESKSGRGSTFTFTAPLKKLRADSEFLCYENTDHPEKKGEKNEDAPCLNGTGVLVAEDNDINQEVAVSFLNDMGIMTDAVLNGKAAVEAVQKGHYDAILMDVRMPEMDGYEATRKIREYENIFRPLNRIPIIAMTAHAMQGDREKCLAADMNDYISKPFDQEGLYKVLARWIKTGERGKRTGPCEQGVETGTELLGNDAFPPVDGVDVTSALQRLKGDTILFRKLLRNFAEKWSDIPVRMKDAMTRSETEQLRSLAHTLKGVAGNLSAFELQNAAAELEAVLQRDQARETRISAEIETNIRDMEAAWARIIQSLKHLEGSENEVSDTGNERRLSIDELKPMLMTLSEALEAYDPDAEYLMEPLIRHLAHLDVEAERRKLEIQVAQFDFRNARETFRKILEKLNIKF